MSTLHITLSNNQ